MVEKTTLNDFIRYWSPRFRDAGIEEPRQELRFLLREALDWEISEQYLRADEALSAEALGRLQLLAARREAREPLSHIFQSAYFYGHRFFLSEDGLAPRPESELLVETARELLSGGRNAGVFLAEFCCGCGAPGLSLLKSLCEEGNAPGSLLLSDIDSASLAVAERNSRQLGIRDYCRFEAADLVPGDLREESLSLILINPPYIPGKTVDQLMPEVRLFESARCLDGGEDGLDFYRRIAREIPFCLARGGWIIMEHGEGQRSDILDIFRASEEFDSSLVKEDFSGKDRLIACRRKPFR